MAIFTLTTNSYTNLPPNQIGDNKLSIDYNETYIFTVNNFTSETVPTFNDPEGDTLNSIKILSLPTTGTLYLNAVAVIINDEIPVASINSNLFTYIADIGTITAYIDKFTYDLSDVGSLTYSGLIGTMNLSVLTKENLPPSVVGDNSLTTNYGASIIFTVADFTTGTTPPYSDPEGDSASQLKITRLPLFGIIKLNGVPIVINQTISFTDIASGLLTFVPDLTVTTGDIQTFEFEIADAGSGIFTS